MSMARCLKLLATLAGAAILAACGSEPAETPDAESTAVAAAAVAAPAKPATEMSDDPITALCIYYGDQLAPCGCATESFRASEPDAKLYADIAALFLADDTPGKDRTERWEDAQNTVLTKAGRNREKMALNNRLGRGHRDAIKSCSG
jgi:hypothetical protein